MDRMGIKTIWRIRFFVALIVCGGLVPGTARAVTTEGPLSSYECRLVDRIVKKLGEHVKKHTVDGSAQLMSFPDLYEPLNDEEQEFLEALRTIDPRSVGITIPFQGFSRTTPDLVPVVAQIVCKGTKNQRVIPPRFLPREVYIQYKAMMAAMERDIGKRLYVQSGYRSGAYQMYLFISRLQYYDYSLRRTIAHVTLPGYSEHGWPSKQAIDFVNEEGITGEFNPKLFENLTEYQWLMVHAKEYGFMQSYPRRTDPSRFYEPWHWRYAPKKEPYSIPVR